MRKIEEEMLKAIRKKRNWRKRNTSVELSDEGTINVRLFGNLIAKVYPSTNSMTLYDGGHRTVSTKSRLNALLSNSNCYIFQKNWIWYISLGGDIYTFKNNERYYMCGTIGETSE